MDEETTLRFVVLAPSGRYLFYSNEEDVQDWDGAVLEIELPLPMALLVDATQLAYFNIQSYAHECWKQAESQIGGELEIDNEFQRIVEDLKDE